MGRDNGILHAVGSRPQRTLRRTGTVQGVGFVTGADITVRFLPSEPSTGIVFQRTDLRHRPTIPASVAYVTNTSRRTTLSVPGAEVSLVEHVLSALAGLNIDNCVVELDGPETPGMDGSSRAFVDALLDAEPVAQSEPHIQWGVSEPVVLRDDRSSIALYPTSTRELTGTYFLDYGPTSPIHRQSITRAITPTTYSSDLAPCRTFILEEEVTILRQQGLGSRTTPSDLLVFGPRGPIDNRVRFANEPARHKLLDIVGDLALLGADLIGHVIACRAGHRLNVELARTLHEHLHAQRVRRVA